MRSVRELLILSAIGWSLMVSFAVTARAVRSQGEIPDSRPTTKLEQALIGRACSAGLPSGSIEIEAHMQCLSARLRSLRADFGYDMSRLSASERKKLDSTCSRTRPAEGRDAYLDCLGAGLVSLHNRLVFAHPAAAQESAPAPAPASEPSADPAQPALQAPSWPLARLMGATATLGAVVIAAGIVLVALRSRPARRQCRVCSAAAPDAGDLCPACRHQAAEALRQAAADRADRERAQYEREQRQRKAPDEEDAQRRREEEAHQREDNARRRQAENIRHQSRPATAAPEPVEQVLDSYAILGVSRDASQERIRFAYQEARLKYDGTAVAHLGDEVREHFRAKAEAIEEAYQVLAGDRARDQQTDPRITTVERRARRAR